MSCLDFTFDSLSSIGEIASINVHSTGVYSIEIRQLIDNKLLVAYKANIFDSVINTVHLLTAMGSLEGCCSVVRIASPTPISIPSPTPTINLEASSCKGFEANAPIKPPNIPKIRPTINILLLPTLSAKLPNGTTVEQCAKLDEATVNDNNPVPIGISFWMSGKQSANIRIDSVAETPSNAYARFSLMPEGYEGFCIVRLVLC